MLASFIPHLLSYTAQCCVARPWVRKLQPVGVLPVNKVHRNSATSICLHLVYGCYCPRATEMSACDGDRMARARELEIVTSWPFREKVY